MDYATLQSRVLGRLNTDSADPVAANVGYWVNDALHYLESTSAEGYPWMRQTITLTTTANDRDYTFTQLGALTSNGATINKILDASILSQSVYLPLDLINDETSTLYYGGTTAGTPEAWFAEGQMFYLYPTPASADTVRLRVTAIEPDLGGSTSTPVIPTVFHGAIIDAALVEAYQTLQDQARLQQQEKKVDEWIIRMRKYGAEYASAPKITVRDPLWT